MTNPTTEWWIILGTLTNYAYNDDKWCWRMEFVTPCCTTLMYIAKHKRKFIVLLGMNDSPTLRTVIPSHILKHLSWSCTATTVSAISSALADIEIEHQQSTRQLGKCSNKDRGLEFWPTPRISIKFSISFSHLLPFHSYSFFHSTQWTNDQDVMLSQIEREENSFLLCRRITPQLKSNKTRN